MRTYQGDRTLCAVVSVNLCRIYQFVCWSISSAWRLCWRRPRKINIPWTSRAALSEIAWEFKLFFRQRARDRLSRLTSMTKLPRIAKKNNSLKYQNSWRKHARTIVSKMIIDLWHRDFIISQLRFNRQNSSRANCCRFSLTSRLIFFVDLLPSVERQ